MSDLDRLNHLLAQSGDGANPSPEELRTVLLSLRRIAVVGISRDPRKDARRVPSYLAAKGIDVLPVNPHAEWLLGRPSKARIEDVEDRVDLVLLFRPSEDAGDLIPRAARRPERPCVWLQEGIRADAPAAAARSEGIRVVQDLCLFKAHRALAANVTRPPGLP
jgi:uncharacterized protein